MRHVMWPSIPVPTISNKKDVSPIYIRVSPAFSVATMAANRYVPRGRDELHTILQHQFSDSCEHYYQKCAPPTMTTRGIWGSLPS